MGISLEKFPWLFAAKISNMNLDALIFRRYLPPQLTAEICRGNLQQEFTVTFYHESMSWLFAVGFLYK